MLLMPLGSRPTLKLAIIPGAKVATDARDAALAAGTSAQASAVAAATSAADAAQSAVEAAGSVTGVASVNGMFGAVTLDHSDVGALPESYVPAWADVSGKPTTLLGYGITDAQPLDADLTALAALTGTNTLYYRSAASTWSAVTIGEGISFSAGTMSWQLPIGLVVPYAGAAAPAKWLLCYGHAVSRTAYAALFAAIGTTYGSGDGSTTFNLPDLRGRAVAGQDDMGGVSADRLTGLSGSVDGDALGAAGGEEAHVLTAAEMPSHSHTYSMASGTAGTGAPNTPDTAGSVSNSYNTSSAGGDGAHNTVQPTIILNYIIYAGA